MIKDGTLVMALAKTKTIIEVLSQFVRELVRRSNYFTGPQNLAEAIQIQKKQIGSSQPETR